MAHFARLDTNNIVLSVHKVNNDILTNDTFPDSEAEGVTFLQSVHGEDAIFKQTSYNHSFRKRFAGIGYSYNTELDAFVTPQPFQSWRLNEETADWEAPIPMPDHGDDPDCTCQHKWDEYTQTWTENKYLSDCCG